MSPAPQQISVQRCDSVGRSDRVVGAERHGDRRGDDRALVPASTSARWCAGDKSRIVVGAGSNLQDGVVVHADPGFPATIGSGVSVGHAAVLHGCTIEDDCLIGMGAIVLNGAVVGAGSMIAAGAVVLEGAASRPGRWSPGCPGKVRRELSAAERDKVVQNATGYVELTAAYRDAGGHEPA